MSSDTISKSSAQFSVPPQVDRIESQLSEIFSKNTSNNLIKITDFGVTENGEDSVSATASSIRSGTVSITNLKALSSHLQRSQSHPLRIISCCSPNSVLPLALTKSMFMHILSVYEIDRNVMDAMTCLGSRARTSEAGMGNLIFRRNHDGTRELHYRLVYIEHVATQNGGSWAIRQTVVIQKSWSEGKRNLFILFHPSDDGQVGIERQVLSSQDQNMDWCAVHLMIFSWYLPEWRGYIRHLGVLLDKAIDFALTFDMSQMSGMGKDPSRLQQLHHLYDEIICMSAWIKTSSDILQEMEILNHQLTDNGNENHESDISNATQLSHHIHRLHAFTGSASLMKERVSSTLKLFEVGIQQDNHRLVSALNRGMLGLAETTAADNVTVKTVTLVTLIFLPANLVAAILGTNFFSSENADNRFSMSSKFWMFFAISVPITILTVGGWMLYSRIHRKKRQTNPSIRSLDDSC